MAELMLERPKPRIYRRLPVYFATTAAAFVSFYLAYKDWGISPVRGPLWQWTAFAFAVGCLSPIFCLVVRALAGRGNPVAWQWLAGAAASLIVFILSPAGLFLADKLVGNTILLLARVPGLTIEKTILDVFFAVTWITTAWVFFDIVRALARPGVFADGRPRGGGSIWLMAGLWAVVGVVAWFDAGRKPEAWEHVDDGAPRGFTYDTTPVPMTIQGVNVTIPRAYIWPWGPPPDAEKRRHMETINIKAHLPDMQPIQPGNAECFTHQTICHDVAWGFLLAGDPPPLERQYRGRLKADPNELPTGPFGLHEVLDDDNSLLVEGKLDGELVTYLCIKGTRTCSFRNGALAPGIAYSYQIDESQLEHWTVVHAAIRERYRSFLEGAATSPTRSKGPS